MKEEAFVLRTHEEAPLANDDAYEVHRLIGVTRRAESFKAIDLHLIGGMLIPARFGPWRFAVATVAERSIGCQRKSVDRFRIEVIKKE